LLPNRKIHEREKKKQRAFFDELFGELLWSSATKFLLKLSCARVFQSIHFFPLRMGCSLWPVMRIRRLLCRNFTSFRREVCLFSVFESVWDLWFFLDPEKGRGESAAV
jgi:hypothetical protein